MEARWMRHLSPESREQQEESKVGKYREGEIYSQSVGAGGMQQPRWVRAVARAQTGMVAEREGEVPAHALLVEQVVRLSLPPLGNGGGID